MSVQASGQTGVSSNSQPLLEVKDLRRYFHIRTKGGLF